MDRSNSEQHMSELACEKARLKKDLVEISERNKIISAVWDLLEEIYDDVAELEGERQAELLEAHVTRSSMTDREMADALVILLSKQKLIKAQKERNNT